MNADRLFALYDRVADAPDAVGRLRRFVLDLAVRGKLVEQNPVDEPASELLKRIAAEQGSAKGEGGKIPGIQSDYAVEIESPRTSIQITGTVAMGD